VGRLLQYTDSDRGPSMNPSTSTPLRIGLVGAGWVTQHHLAAWHEQADAVVVAIADPSQQRATEKAEQFGISRIYRSAEEMLHDGGIDAVDIAAPREFHAPLVRLAASRGLPILCQKPLAPTYGEAVALVAGVADRSRLMVHENWRFRAYYRQIAAWLREGRIGKVTQAQMTLLSSGLVPDARGELPALVRQPFLATLDRALVMEIAIHHIDTLRFLLGELQLVHARLGRGCAAMSGEDRAFASFETADAAPVCLFANLAAHGEHPVLSDRLLLVGERGTIRLTGDTLSCDGEQPAQLEYDPAATYLQSYAAAIAHFVQALRSGAPFETSPADNLATLRLVEDIYAS
jgi:predicted dehydrogenase